MLIRLPSIGRKQRGSALIISLLILVLLLIISTTSMQTTTLEERMAGNTRDQNKAFQSAEAGLRDGELDVKSSIYSITNFTTTCTNGLCDSLTTPPANPYWQTIDWNGNLPRNYGITTTFATIPEVFRQPRYILENIPDPAATGSLTIGGTYGSPGTGLFRITAQGYGAAADDANLPLARAMLQSVFRK